MNLDDPKLTAYALGELEEVERVQFEEQMRQDPAALAEVDAIRSFTSRLRDEMHHETMPALTEEQRAEVFAAASGATEGNHAAPANLPREQQEVVELGGRRRPLWIPAAIAASVAVMAGVSLWFLREQRQEPAWEGKIQQAVRPAETVASRSRTLAALEPAPSAPPAPAATPIVLTGAAGGAMGEMSARPYYATKDGPNAPATPNTLGVDYLVREDGAKSVTPALATANSLVRAPAKSPAAFAARGGAAPLSAPAAASPEEPLNGPALTMLDTRAADSAAAPLAAAAPASAMGRRALALNTVADKFSDRAFVGKKEKKALSPVETVAAGGNPFSEAQSTPVAILPMTDSSGDISTIREALSLGRLPAKEAVRLEEVINAFPGRTPIAGASPVTANLEMASCPWDTRHWLLRVGIIGGAVATSAPALNLAVGSPGAAGSATGSGAQSGQLAEVGEAAMKRLGGRGVQLADEDGRTEKASAGDAPVALKTDESRLEPSTVVAWSFHAEVAFEPARVASYRLLGYDQPANAAESESVDEFALQAGRRMVFLYELEPAKADPAKTGRIFVRADASVKAGKPATAVKDQRAVTLRMRWSPQPAATSVSREIPLNDVGLSWKNSTPEFRESAAAAAFGLLLQDSPSKGSATWNSAWQLAPQDERNSGEPGSADDLKELILKARAARP